MWFRSAAHALPEQKSNLASSRFARRKMAFVTKMAALEPSPRSACVSPRDLSLAFISSSSAWIKSLGVVRQGVSQERAHELHEDGSRLTLEQAVDLASAAV